MLNILTTPDPILRHLAKKVTHYDRRIQDIVTHMEQTLIAAKNPEGVGLAAPQVGISLQLFLARPSKKHKIRLFINPKILHLSDQQQSPDLNDGVYEGCLSIPGHYAPVSRSYSLKLEYFSPITNSTNLVKKTENFSGFMAHIIQHEVDHLQGVLFVDRVLEQNTKLFKVSGKEWEEVSL